MKKKLDHYNLKVSVPKDFNVVTREGITIRETDENGNNLKYPRDNEYSPHTDNVWFQVKNIEFNESIRGDTNYLPESISKTFGFEFTPYKKDPSHTFERSISKSINGDLIPDDSTKFVMFGTTREIKKFYFQIYYSSTSEGLKESYCYLSGAIENLDEDSISGNNDSICLHIMLTYKDFLKLSKQIIENRISSMKIRISNVDGFYCEWLNQQALSWNHTDQVDEIKVLINEDDTYQIEMPKENEFELPTIGHVRSFSISTKTKRNVDFVDYSDENEDQDEDNYRKLD